MRRRADESDRHHRLPARLSLNSAGRRCAYAPGDFARGGATRITPDVSAARRGWQAATQVPSQVLATLPDPQVTVQSFSVGSPRPFAGYSNSEFAYIGLGVSQDIPYPGKLKLKGEAAQQDAAISRDKLDAARRSVLQQVKEAYFQTAYIQQTLEVLDRNGKLLDQIEKIADARYRVGQGKQQDVLKAQLEKTKLLREVAHHHELMGTQQALVKLLNRPPGSPEITTEPLAPYYSAALHVRRAVGESPGSKIPRLPLSRKW